MASCNVLLEVRRSGFWTSLNDTISLSVPSSERRRCKVKRRPHANFRWPVFKSIFGHLYECPTVCLSTNLISLDAISNIPIRASTCSTFLLYICVQYLLSNQYSQARSLELQLCLLTFQVP